MKSEKCWQEENRIKGRKALLRPEDSGLLGPGERMECCEWCFQVWSVVAGSGRLPGRKVEIARDEETRKQVPGCQMGVSSCCPHLIMVGPR